MGKASCRRRDLHRQRTIKLPPEAVEALEEQEHRFIEKFGRPPGPGDPIFFDPDAAEPRSMTLQNIEASGIELLQQMGADPAVIYAFQQTGMMPPIPGHGYSRADVQEWNEAVARYHILNPSDSPDLDQGMTDILVDVVLNPQERLPELTIAMAGLLSKEHGFDGIAELMGRISELEGEDGTVGTQIFLILLSWLTTVRERYPAEVRERVADAGTAAATALESGIGAVLVDLRTILGIAGASDAVTVGELLDRHSAHDVLMGAWVLVHGVVSTLGKGDPSFLEQLGFPTGYSRLSPPPPRHRPRRPHRGPRTGR